MIKIYLFAVATGLSVVLIYGLLVPSLISAKSDLAVIFGVIVGFGAPVIGLIGGRKFINSLIKTKEK
ncbi:TPA: hypothetical protein OQQ88_000050 [Shigella sonnei]|uniref:hypothetical protein n=1 Tax=Enterobacteriaceae TaxID=543 RepID=UPI000B94594D|nr:MULTISPECIES: hypothetical protein [Enterobacteriaceae]EJF7890962.1 hypothetical protein [Shigella sonnei]OYB97802.1 hypothetical protein RX27_04457 [Escherichia coli]OYC00084.1 hypothetical protein RX26_04487 [Escherichia coli]OYC39334.1 hypothetical protein RX28_04445 [Escherichia coli]HCR6140673.1 hypothetical protein [Shigella sonnei]